VGSSNLQRVAYPAAPLPNTEVLQELYLHDAIVNPALILEAIASPWLSNLRTLSVEGPGRNSRRWKPAQYQAFDHEKLKKTLLRHLTRLEVLGWWDMSDEPDACDETPVTPFGSFAEFLHMRTLSIDWALLVG
jgi:hypothetical protein